jgi:acetone carboxylase gamma subunit
MATIKREKGMIYLQEQSSTSEKKWRKIGKVTGSDGRTLNVIRDRQKHLWKIHNGYGFNKFLLDKNWFDHIVLIETNGEETNNYIIPVSDIITESTIEKANKFDPQYVYSLEKLEEHKFTIQ